MGNNSMKIILVIIISSILVTGYSQTDLDYLKSGQNKFMSKDFAGAIADLSNYIDIHENDTSLTAYAYQLRGAAKHNIGDFRGAILDFDKTLNVYQESNNYYLRGDCKENLKDYKGALNDYDKAIELSPKDEFYYYKRGCLKLKLNDKDGGCLDLSKAGELGLEGVYDKITKECN
jgi:tetratricopeptide (TPR) repeat protein